MIWVKPGILRIPMAMESTAELAGNGAKRSRKISTDWQRAQGLAWSYRCLLVGLFESEEEL